MSFPQVGETLSNGYTVDSAYAMGIYQYVLAHKNGDTNPFGIWWVGSHDEIWNGRGFGNQKLALQHWSTLMQDVSLVDGNNYEQEIIIRHEKGTLELSVLINGELQPHIKCIEVRAVDGRPICDYQCTMYAPIPL